MPRSSVIALALFVVLAGATGEPRSSGADGATAFVTGIEDLPLMSGLTEVADSAFVFDTPEGRLVESRAVGRVPADRVEAFYEDTLPQLGWTMVAPRAFVREGESLRIELSLEGEQLSVQFLISPEPF